ncbi:hypothetical protein LVB77_03585 [Lysobacter sp. 5GHs7-4]|uniref:hypothetical protein n=1 Tax=Lysobacter sp. 5GHs7-4 TaxID=2904253 RepID=UPI001E42DAF0|nr:hypothetical protein [Lysobacter sp. 5GHs7-4]UHQ23804.1 hypothetical protein LVB77_03585 [Lysobacter sp. 5GHs7-4]
MNPSPPRSWPHWTLPLAVLASVLLAQALLVLNPGYYSHDELQWAAYAAQHPGWHFRDYLWTDAQSFQYRPLTFSVWLWLSEHLFARPLAFHALMVGLGGLNAAMLAVLLHRFGVAAGPAFGAALVFALGPFAALTHGWVGTLADLIWVGCALLSALLAQRERPGAVSWAAIFVLTALALLAKEAGIVIPALLGLAWLFLGRRREWLIAALVAGVPVAVYLALRVGVLLFSPREAVNYGWSLAFIPERWLEYQLYPPIATKMAIAGTLSRGLGDGRVWLAILVWLATAAALWRVGARWCLGWLLAGTAALGPVMILAESANQYGYGYAAATAAVCAAAWPRMQRWGRIVLIVAALLSVWHGVNVMRRMHEVGTIQAVYSPAMAQAVQRAGGAPVRLSIADAGQAWIYERLSHDIPSYDGVEIGDRVQLVAANEAPDYEIQRDGSLKPLR